MATTTLKAPYFTYPVNPVHSARLFLFRYELMLMKLILRRVRANVDPNEDEGEIPHYLIWHLIREAEDFADSIGASFFGTVFFMLYSYVESGNGPDFPDFWIRAVVKGDPDHQLSLNEMLIKTLDWAVEFLEESGDDEVELFGNKGDQGG